MKNTPLTDEVESCIRLAKTPSEMQLALNNLAEHAREMEHQKNELMLSDASYREWIKNMRRVLGCPELDAHGDPGPHSRARELVTEVVRVKDLNNSLREEISRMLKAQIASPSPQPKRFIGTCSWCNHQITNDDKEQGISDITAHTMACEKNPIHAIRKENADLKILIRMTLASLLKPDA